ncbi:MAG TPA: nuclear transport factor 2 family protein [Baekduia sp.]|nr:nuclear transport factor 2 family protein [Baekduia sp.]
MSDTTVQSNLGDRLSQARRIEDVFCGSCSGAELRDSPAWPGERWASVGTGPVTRNERRTIEEYVLHPANDADPTLPLAVVWEHDGGDVVARLYYSARLLGDTIMRGPIAPPETDTEPNAGVARYFTALAAGDIAALHDAVDDTYIFRDPSGGRTEGREAIDGVFRGIAGRGGIRLAHQTITTDGSRTAVEFLSYSTDPPHSGLAIYEQDTDERLAAARIYE